MKTPLFTLFLLTLLSTPLHAESNAAGAVFIPPITVQHAQGNDYYRAMVHVDQRIFSMCLPERERALELVRLEVERYYHARQIEVIWNE